MSLEVIAAAVALAAIALFVLPPKKKPTAELREMGAIATFAEPLQPIQPFSLRKQMLDEESSTVADAFREAKHAKYVQDITSEAADFFANGSPVKK